MLNKALQDAADTTEVFLNRIPGGVSSTKLAKEVNNALTNVTRKMAASGEHAPELLRSKYVLRCKLDKLLLTPSTVSEKLLND